MIRKFLAITVAAAMGLTAPGMGELFAQDGGREVMMGKQVVVIPNEENTLGSDLNVRELKKEINELKIAPDVKERALDIVGRMEPYLKDGRVRPADVKAMVEKFEKQARNPGANKEIALGKLFDGLQSFAVKTEKYSTFEQVIEDHNDLKVVRVMDGVKHRMVQENRIEKLDEKTQRITVYKPDPNHPGQNVIEQVAYAYTVNGVTKQKVVYNHRLAMLSEAMRRQFLTKPDIQAQLDECEKKADDKNEDRKCKQADIDELNKQLEMSRKRYNESDLESIYESMQDSGARGPKTFGKRVKVEPGEVENMSKQLEDDQRAISGFYAEYQLENLQKVQLIELVMYFVKTLGLNYNPFNESKSDKEGVGIANMKPEEAQDLLNKFEQGGYNGYGLFTDLAAKWHIHNTEYRKIDSEKDLPPALKAIASKAIRFLGNAENAKVRMKTAPREEAQAYLDELNLWNKLASVQIQKFEILMHTIELRKLKTGKNAQEVRLRSGATDNDAAEAERLIAEARLEFMPKFAELEQRSQANSFEQAALSFKNNLQNARYTLGTRDNMKDQLKAMAAKVRELKGLFLADKYLAFTSNEANLEAFRKAQDPKDYYAKRMDGGLYKFFEDRLDPETRGKKEKFEALARRFDDLKNDSPESVRSALPGLQSQADEMLRTAGVSGGLDQEALQKQAKSLGVYQHWLGAATQEFNKDVNLFLQINMFDLAIEKSVGRREIAETRPQDWQGRIGWIFGMNWMNNGFDKVTSLFIPGGRAATRDTAVRLGDKASWEIFAAPGKDGGMGQVERREAIRRFMREGDYQKAADEAARIDAESAAKALKEHKASEVNTLEDFGQDMETILTKGFERSAAQTAEMQGSLTGMQEHLQNYILYGMAGQAAGDFVIMTVGTLGIGAVVGAGTSAAAKFSSSAGKFFGGLEDAQKLTRVSRFMKNSAEFGGRFFEGMTKGVTYTLAFPEVGTFLNSPARSLGSMWLTSARFNARNMAIVGATSAGISSGMYALNPAGSGAKSWKQAAAEGALGGMSWGAKGGWTFMLLPPANAWQGSGVISKSYRGLGNVVGPADGIGRFVLTKFTPDSAMAKVIAEQSDGALGQQGMWSQVASKVGSIEHPFWRGAASTGLKLAMNADGALKFIGWTEGIAEVVQAGAYYTSHAISQNRKNAEEASGEKTAAPREAESSGPAAPRAYSRAAPDCENDFGNEACYQPSEHIESLVNARHWGMATQQATMMTMPSPGYFDPKQIAKSKEIQAGMTQLFQRGGKPLNDFFAKSTGGNEKVTVKTSHWTLPLRAFAKKEVEVPVTSDTKQMMGEWLLRKQFKKKQIGLAELFAMETLVSSEPPEAGQDRKFNYQRFWSPAELRDVAAGKKVEPKASAADPDAIYLVPELRDVAAKMIEEQISSNPSLVAKLRDIRPRDTLLFSTSNGVMEIERSAAGKIVADKLAADPATAADVKAKTPENPLQFDHLPPIERKTVEKIVTEKLDGDPKLAALLAAQAVGTRPGEILRLGEVDIARGSVIRTMQERATWLTIKANDKAIKKSVMSGLQAAEKAGGGSVDPANLQAKFIKVWDEMVAKEQKGKEPERNLAWAMERVKDQRMTEYLLEYNMNYFDRRIGHAAGAQIPAEVDRAVGAINAILGFKGMKNPRTGQPITSLRGLNKDGTGRRGQKEMLAEFFTDVLKGADPAEAYNRAVENHMKVFSFLEASGGKTLIIKTAFAPLMQVRAEKQGKKLWIASSNRLLAEQMKTDDWPSYSGGEAPAFKITSLDEVIFEEVRRKQQGQRSLAGEYVLAIDEGDEAFRKPSHSIGEDQGGITMGSRLIDVNMKGLEWMQAKLAEVQAKPEAERDAAMKAMIPEIEREIPGMAKQLAGEWRDKYAEIHMSAPAYYLLKAVSLVHPSSDPAVRERIEAENAAKVIRAQFGRMYDLQTQPDKKILDKIGLFMRDNDGLEGYFKLKLQNQLQTLTLKDKSQFFRNDPEKGLTVPVNYGSEMPTLATEHRYAAQLLLMQELKQKGITPEKPVRLDLDLEHSLVMHLNEFYQRMKETDMVLTSGTAGKKVEEFLSKMIGMRFSNEEGKTKAADRTLIVGDEAGDISVVKPNAAPEKIGVAKDVAGLKIDLPPGIDYHDTETVKLLVHMVKQKMSDPAEKLDGNNPLIIITPRSLNELKVIEKALVDAGIATNGADSRGVKNNTKDEFVRFFPDFVQRSSEGGELEEMTRLNNKDAMADGSAKIVLLVPEIGGRGVDLPFGKYRGKIIKIGLHTHDVAQIEAIQADARMGPGRVQPIPKKGNPKEVWTYNDRAEFIDITHAQTLKSDDSKNGYLAQVQKIMKLANDPNAVIADKDVKDSVDAMKLALPKDPAALQKLKDGAVEGLNGQTTYGSEFKDFAARGDVYKLVHPQMQEAKQIEANQSSGILDKDGNLKPDDSKLTTEDVTLLSRGIMSFGSIAMWLGAPWYFALPPSIGFGMGTDWVGKKILKLQEKRLQDEIEQSTPAKTAPAKPAAPPPAPAN